MLHEQWPALRAEAEAEGYRSTFAPSEKAEEILRTGRILGEGETAEEMVERMTDALFSVEVKFGVDPDASARVRDAFGKHLDAGDCVMSTPVMTNAGRYTDRPLSACTVPPVDLRHDLAKAKEVIQRFHEDGMGTGFNLDDLGDPVSVLAYLNKVAVEGAASGKEDRPVGNMGVLSVSHPKIVDFISAKDGADARGEEWKFNISVNITDTFMHAVKEGRMHVLTDGTTVDARDLFRTMASSAWACGDPGLAFIDRMNEDNPTPGVGAYVSTAPCAEVGLAPGESCQFGYLNLGKFVREKSGRPEIDWEELGSLARLMTRALDNALEISIDHYHHPLNAKVMRAKRKIGVGVCGLADLLTALKVPYDDAEGRRIAEDVIAFINYQTKLASLELGEERGSFGAMSLPIGCRYTEDPGFIARKYGSLETTKVSAKMWNDLDRKVRESRTLRHASTIALPPTGRSGLIIDATPGVEPLFSLVNYDGSLNTSLLNDLAARGLDTPDLLATIREQGRIGHLSELPSDLRSIYKTAVEIAPAAHLRMAASLQNAVDESISKTVNLPRGVTEEDVEGIYMQAYDLGLKGVTVFRTGSRKVQPRQLARS